MLSFKESAYLTLSFFHALEFAPTRDELLRSLFFFGGSSDQASFDAIDGMYEEDGYLFLNGYSHLVGIRGNKNILAKQLWRKVDRWKWLFHLIPWLRCVCICNNLSFGNVTEKSDIDLFIIAGKNRLFLVRAFLTVLFHLLALRRHGTKIAGRFCLSFFASEDVLNFEALQKIPKNDLYFAFWMQSLKPVYDEGTFRPFIEQNHSWLKEYFPNQYRLESFPVASEQKENKETGIKDRIMNHIERFTADYQLKRAEAKRERLPSPDGTILQRTLLKFHDVDRRKEILEKTLLIFSKVRSESPSR